MDRLIHDSFFNIDKIYLKYSWLDTLAVNHYQLLTVAWNIILTAVPLVIFLALKKYWRKTGLKKYGERLMAVVLFVFWLLFMPNTAYIITDVRHLLDYCPIDSPDKVCAPNAWMIMFFFAYSSFGWVAFYYLLKAMSELIGEIFHKLWSNVFVALAVPAVALGVLLGLINRFNSLDIFFFPKQLFLAFWSYLSSPAYFMDWLVFTIVLYGLYFSGELLFKKINTNQTNKRDESNE